MTRTGQCHCGSVQYAVEGELPYVVHCHCTNCRRAHGAAFFTAGFVAKKNFEVTAGTDCLVIAPFQNGAPGGRAFCRNCGSHVFNNLDMFEGLMNFSIATLHEAPSVLDSVHINTESKVDWLQLPEDTLQHEAFPPDLEEQIGKILNG